MKGFHGGQIVPGGLYLKRSTLEMENMGKMGGILPGEGTSRYTRLPLSTAMVAGPALGLGYVVLLPVTAFLGLVYYFVRRASHRLDSTEHSGGGIRQPLY